MSAIALRRAGLAIRKELPISDGIGPNHLGEKSMGESFMTDAGLVASLIMKLISA